MEWQTVSRMIRLWSESTLFTQNCLLENLGSLWYNGKNLQSMSSKPVLLLKTYTDSIHDVHIYEPPWQKPTKWHVCPAKTQISLGIHPVWAASSLGAQWTAKNLSFLHADSKDGLVWADAQANPSLPWVQRSFCSFCHKAAHISLILQTDHHFATLVYNESP